MAKGLNRSDYVKLAIVIIIIVLAFNLKYILTIATGSETPIAVVKGYSMYPLLREGDLVFAYKPSPDKIHVGDIVIYRGIRGELIIHRVIRIVKINNKYYYVTKGDNNPIPDYPEFQGPGIPYIRIEGVIVKIGDSVLKIQYLGYLSIWFHGG
jgi:signal peptidase